MTGDDDTWFVACARTVRGSQCLRFKIHTCIFFLGYRRMNGWWPRSEAGSRPDGGSSGSVHHVSDKPYSGRYSIGVQKGGWRCNGRDHHLSVTHTHRASERAREREDGQASEWTKIDDPITLWSINLFSFLYHQSPTQLYFNQMVFEIIPPPSSALLITESSLTMHTISSSGAGKVK